MAKTENKQIDLVKFDRAVIYTGGVSSECSDGWYVTDAKMKSIAKGSAVLKSKLKAAEKERDAYKTAYESALLELEKTKSLLDEMHIKYNERVEETEKMLDTYAAQVNELSRANAKLRRSNKLFTIGGLAVLIGGTVAACR